MGTAARDEQPLDRGAVAGEPGCGPQRPESGRHRVDVIDVAVGGAETGRDVLRALLAAVDLQVGEPVEVFGSVLEDPVGGGSDEF